MLVTFKLLNNNKLSNIMENKYCIVSVKNPLLKIMEDFTVAILWNWNFGKQSILNYF